MLWGHLQRSAFVRNTGKHNARLSLGHYLMVTENMIPASACPRLGTQLRMVLSLAVIQRCTAPLIPRELKVKES